MASVLSLAMKVTADASGLEASLSPVDKALASLSTKANDVASMFDKFLASTTGAADAQANVRTQLEQLAEAMKNGEISAQQYAASFSAIQASAQQTASIFQDGAATIEKYRTEEEKTALAVERLNQQFKAGAIDQDTYSRAIADVTGENERAAKAEGERNRFLERAAQLTRAVVSPMEDYDSKVQELVNHLQEGTITQQTFDRNLEIATKEFVEAANAADGYSKSTKDAGKEGTLAFNELSGILAAIPGPIGNIAGRMSGLSSAAEGLGRVFSGGLGSGFSSLAGAASALLNPFTLAVAGIAAFGAAAAAIGAGLQQLTGRVEELQNTASRLGTSFEFAQVLEQAALRSGVAVDQLASGLQRFEVNISKAREGGNAAADAFQKLGISQEELQTSDPTNLAGRVADALANIEDPAERARLATELLGKSGLELLPAFASIDDAAASMDKFRATISEVDVQRLSSLDDVFDDIGVALQGLGTQLLVPFTGLAEGVADALTEAISGITRFIDPILDALTPVFDGLGVLISDFASLWGDAAEVAGNAIGGFIDVAVRLGTIIGTAVTETIGYVSDLIVQFGEFTGLGGVISSVASGIASAFGGLWDGIKNVVGQVGGFIEQVLKFAEDWLGIDRGIAAANDSYREQADIVKKTAEESDKKAKAEEEAARKAVEANTKIVDSLLEQLTIEEQFGGDNARFKAAQNVEAIEKEIARVREEVEKARAAGDTEAAQAGMERLAQLDQIQAQQEDIASGAAADRKAAAEAQKRIAEEQRKAADEQRKQEEDRRKRLEDNAKKIAEAQKKYIEAAFELEKKRIGELNQLRLGALEISDIRTGAGSAAFLDLASGRQDPAIDEYRKQRKQLEELNKNVKALQIQKAEILGATG